jgi:hypothetical protein
VPEFIALWHVDAEQFAVVMGATSFARLGVAPEHVKPDG